VTTLITAAKETSSNELITVNYASLERSFSPAEVEYK